MRSAIIADIADKQTCAVFAIKSVKPNKMYMRFHVVWAYTAKPQKIKKIKPLKPQK